LASLVKTEESIKTLVSLIIISSNIQPKAYKIAHKLRSINNSINIDVQLSEASLKSKLRRANKDNAAYALIIGDEELKSETIIVKSLLEEVSEQTVMSFKDIESFIKEIK
jgi:histidyl-tRNA synthetase